MREILAAFAPGLPCTLQVYRVLEGTERLEICQGHESGHRLAALADADGLLTSAGSLTIASDGQKGRITGTTLGSLTDAYSYDANGFLSNYVA